MKKTLQQVVLALVFGLALPGAILAVAVSPQKQAAVPVRQGLQVMLIGDAGEEKLLLEDYLVGVLLGELSEDFPLEAVKAQAVAARTYTLRGMQKAVKHPAGAICTDPTCCQRYLSPERYLAEDGSREWVDKARRAVAETAGEVVCYGGQLIDATYFACSGGHTEAALAVWGSDVPYLQAVESPEETPDTQTLQFSAREFYAALGLELSGSPAAWLGEVRHTQGGGVDTMTIAGKIFTGPQLRAALGLRSTAFTLSAVGDTVTVTTRGFGHRVGMSQQGARAMALSGSSYRDILAHYYTGTTLMQYGTALE